MKKTGITAFVLCGICFSGMVCESQAAESKSQGLFQKLDKNNDGKIEKSEVDEEQMKHLERLLRVADADKDGVLSKEEFTKGTGKQKPIAGSESAPGGGKKGRGKQANFDPEKMFQRLDANKDKVLTADELPEQRKPFFSRMIKRLGKNESEGLTQDEFVNTMKKQMSMRQAGQKGKGKPGFDGKKKGSGAEQAGVQGKGKGRAGFRPPQPKLFTQLDTNNDRKVSREELAKIVEMFDKLDENKDGELDVAELIGPPPMRGPRMADAGKPRMKKPNGPNADKKSKKGEAVNKREAQIKKGKGRNLVDNVFKKQDSDGDGNISKSEAQNRLAKRFDKIDTNNDGQIDRAELEQSIANRPMKSKPGQGKPGKNKPVKKKKIE